MPDLPPEEPKGNAGGALIWSFHAEAFDDGTVNCDWHDVPGSEAHWDTSLTAKQWVKSQVDEMVLNPDRCPFAPSAVTHALIGRRNPQGPQAAALIERLEARVAELEAGCSEPTGPGDFVGDIYFGDPRFSTRGTHRWDGMAWTKLPDETETLMILLATARGKVAELEGATTAFLAKWDECKPHIDDAFVHRQLRCGQYTGPDLAEELYALRKASKYLAQGEG